MVTHLILLNTQKKSTKNIKILHKKINFDNGKLNLNIHGYGEKKTDKL